MELILAKSLNALLAILLVKSQDGTAIFKGATGEDYSAWLFIALFIAPLALLVIATIASILDIITTAAFSVLRYTTQFIVMAIRQAWRKPFSPPRSIEWRKIYEEGARIAKVSASKIFQIYIFVLSVTIAVIVLLGINYKLLSTK